MNISFLCLLTTNIALNINVCNCVKGIKMIINLLLHNLFCQKRKKNMNNKKTEKRLKG